MSYKGRFLPKNPHKYNGDPNNIIFRSTWEVRVMKYLDENPNVKWWASEELYVTYISPVDNKPHRYFPDFITKVVNKQGKEITMMLEVKPEKQTKRPEKRRKTKQYIRKQKISKKINKRP